MKKILALSMLFALLTFTACGGGESKKDDKEKTEKTDSSKTSEKKEESKADTSKSSEPVEQEVDESVSEEPKK